MVPSYTVEVSRGEESRVPLDYFIQLARHLAKRNWSDKKRSQEQANEARRFNATSDPVEKSFFLRMHQQSGGYRYQ
jgi:hypothetical protein